MDRHNIKSQELSELEIIKQFAVSLLRQNSLDDLLWDIAHNIGRLLDYEDCVIYLREGSAMVQQAAFGIKNPERRDIREKIQIRIGEGIVGTVAKTGVAELIADTTKEERYISDIFSGMSEITVPIVAEDVVIGIIDSEASQCDQFSQKDLEILQAMANIAASRIATALAQKATAEAVSQGAHFKSQLDNERDWSKTVLNSIQDGIIATDLDSCITMLSHTAAKITGWRFDDAVGKKISEVLTLTPAPVFNGASEKPQIERRGTLLTKSGSSMPVEWKVGPIRSVTGVLGQVYVLRDIQHEQFLEREAAKAQRIESLGVLAGGIAHDFNNNLQAIRSSMELIRLMSGPETERLLETAEKACDQSCILANQLLTFAKGSQPQFESCDIVALLRSTSDLALSGSNSIVEFQFEPGLPTIKADKSQLEQVFGNLILNASQAMSQGGFISISTRTSKMPESNEPAVELTIKDKGSGISGENLERIFDPYFSTKGTGNGLGLTISYSIIKRHKGEILVDSVVGEGTTVKIFFKAEGNGKVTEPFVNEDANQDIVQTRKRILVLDDNDLVLRSTQVLLEKLGHRVVISRSCSEAVTLVQQKRDQADRFEIALLDLTIPGEMGGEQTGVELLKIDPNIKVIVVSGYTSSQIMAEYQSRGFAGAIFKPFNRKKLSQVIDDA